VKNQEKSAYTINGKEYPDEIKRTTNISLCAISQLSKEEGIKYGHKKLKMVFDF
jgi:hypothetical protein